MDFIKTNGNDFIYKDKKINLRGFGVGTWLCLEHFMIGLPSAEQCLRKTFTQTLGEEEGDFFFTAYQKEFLQDSDFDILKEHGVNFIRVPFNYRLFINDNTNTYKQDGFALFDRLFSLCNKHKIFAMIDLHAAPGSQNPDWHSDNNCGIPLFWQYQLFREQTAKLWGTIAARYCNEPYLMGYDLLNEPAMANWSALNEFYEDCISEIRRVDKNHIIVLEGDNFSMDFSGLAKFTDKQLAISFHYYPTVWHPELLDKQMSRMLRIEKIADGIDRILTQTKGFNRPVFCGEFGYSADDCGGVDFAMELLHDTIELLEERQLDWLLWCYKDARFMGLVAPAENSDWMKLVRDIKNVWTQDIEKQQAQQLLNLLAANDFPRISENERYLLQFRLRACLYLLQDAHILQPRLRALGIANLLKLTKDFAGKTCDIQPLMSAIVKKVLLITKWESNF